MVSKKNTHTARTMNMNGLITQNKIVIVNYTKSERSRCKS